MAIDDVLNQLRWFYIGGEDSMVHGPFPSVEMLNWLGGSFFQPNLMLRLLNDTEFYPLGQLFNACGNENPFSLPGTKFEEIVTNYHLSLSITQVQHNQQQQRVQSVPASGGYSSLPATPSSTPTPGPGFGINGVEPRQQQFQQSHHQQQPVPGPPLVPFQVQMMHPPLHPSQFLLMNGPPPPQVGPNTTQMAPAAMFRPGPGPHQPMFSPPNQQQQAPPIPVLTSHAVAFHHHQQQQQFLHQQQSQQQQNGGGPLLPTFPPPPPFSMPETRFPPPAFLQLHHNNLHHQNGGVGAEHQAKREVEESGGQQNHQNLGKEKEAGTAILGMGVDGGGAMGMEASDSPDSGHVVTPCAQPDKSVDTDDAPWNQRPWPLVDKAVGPDASFEANNVGAQTEAHMISPLDAQKWISQLLGFPVLIIEEKKAGKTTKEN